MKNPLRERGENFKNWVKGLSDPEVIDLLEVISNELRDRNQLLKLNSKDPNLRDTIRTMVDTIAENK